MKYFLGLDLGSTSAKAALAAEDGSLAWRALKPAGSGQAAVAAALEAEARQFCAGEIAGVVATGYGRALAACAGRTITEITCQARGVNAMHPDACTILDIGGQDAKCIRLSPQGTVGDFAMNDRCAAGTGGFLELIARRFDLGLNRLAEIWKSNPTPLEISSTCAVFAESEVVGLLAKGERLEDIIAGVHQAIAARTLALFRQVRGEAPLYFAGGVALNETMRRALEGVFGLEVKQAREPQFTAAYGAALLAAGK